MSNTTSRREARLKMRLLMIALLALESVRDIDESELFGKIDEAIDKLQQIIGVRDKKSEDKKAEG